MTCFRKQRFIHVQPFGEGLHKCDLPIQRRQELVHESEIAPEVEEDGYIDFIVPIERLLRN